MQAVRPLRHPLSSPYLVVSSFTLLVTEQLLQGCFYNKPPQIHLVDLFLRDSAAAYGDNCAIIYTMKIILLKNETKRLKYPMWTIIKSVDSFPKSKRQQVSRST